ncbi:MAG: hypothetical protein QOD68_1334 [Actinomycetota bacterium]|jgi:outer membrane protein assembly factor BamB|nr:hypothetical protein [Actinomycetota bacterium]
MSGVTSILPELRVSQDRRPHVTRVTAMGIAAAVALALVAVGVLAVTRSGDHRAAAAPSSVLRAATPWERTDLHAVTQPVAVAGNRLLVYVGEAGKFRLVSLFVGSGVTAWALNASPSMIAPGTAPVTTVIGGTVVFLQPLAFPGAAQVVAVDVESGQVLWRSAGGFFSGWPQVCPDDIGSVCLSGRMASAGDASSLRFDVATGRLGASVTAPDGARELAPTLYGSEQRNPELLVATSGGKIAWQRPLDEIFTMRGASTDRGWNFDRLRHDKLYVGSVGAAPTRTPAGKPAMDLARTATVGLRMSDGRLAWSDSGSYYLCNQLPCAGAPDPGVSDQAAATSAGARVGLRLRGTGLVSWSRRTLEPKVAANARGVIEGFDPATGKTLWTFDVTKTPDLLAMQPVATGPGGQISVTDAKGAAVLLDLETGKTLALPAKAALACTAQTQYRTKVAYRTRLGNTHRHLGQPAVFPCTAQGTRAEGPPPGATWVAIGGSRLAAWSDSTGVYAAPMPAT